MKITYDPSVDVLRIILDDVEIDESDEEVEGIIMDYNPDGKLIGIEILDASQRVDNPYVMNYSVATTEVSQQTA
ncbi:DUF2283 domain-containing protein [Halomicronema sp. CCY15110]|uniref:DUF2283 domain-containing protein n=1 Tax=Halomicronema sp. CCY15110 TaxID=2767773 RepID=UPI00194E834E|nr:DUF2283 domain-containing protein [Halomicronema sp. CCY15110]